MPALIHTSSGFANAKVVLSAQNYTEDNRGLVSANLQFVAKASNRSAVDAMFYTDSAPPIWPTYLDRGRLIGRNLYMQSRSISEQYGLLTIDTLYVGGRERIVPTITSDFESLVEYSAASEPYEISGYDRDNNLNRVLFGGLVNVLVFSYTPLVTSLSFVRVAGIDSFSPQKPKTEDMYTLVNFFSQSFNVNGKELIRINQPRQYFIDLINVVPVIEDRKTESLTPTVQIITIRYSMAG
jgi:hypothetical protein